MNSWSFSCFKPILVKTMKKAWFWAPVFLDEQLCCRLGEQQRAELQGKHCTWEEAYDLSNPEEQVSYPCRK